MRAWVKHLDLNYDEGVSIFEFSRALRKLGFEAKTTEVMKHLDVDGSGDISLSELDPHAEKLWRKFRRWCVANFSNVEEMIEELCGDKLDSTWKAGQIRYQSFIVGLHRLGWENMQAGDDTLLFHVMETNHDGCIEASMLSFLPIEKKRQDRKLRAQQQSHHEPVKMKSVSFCELEKARDKFKSFLKRKFGGYIRAWRCALCPAGFMTLQKVSFQKACMTCGYMEDAKVLWQAFDKDDSGSISIDELDLRSAEILADFRNFVKANFKNSAAAFRALDLDGTRRVKFPEFANALKRFDFHRPARILFEGLNRNGQKTLIEEDLKFLDDWKPLPFLTVASNFQAVVELKELLVSTYKTCLKGFRSAFDVHMANHCNWHEFEAGCKKVGFRGDVPGAWRALDLKLKGYITMMEMDPVTSNGLYDFRVWAELEFGSIRSAFNVLDDDGSKEIAFREFNKCCHIYGFEGNGGQVFKALDINRNKQLCCKELMFVQHWEFPDQIAGHDTTAASRVPAGDLNPVEEKLKQLADAAKSNTSSRDALRDTCREARDVRNRQARPQTVAERLGREGRPDSASRRGALPSLPAGRQEEEQEVEPMILVTIELAEPLYAQPPYRLARSFRPRHTAHSLAPLPWSPAPEPPPTAGFRRTDFGQTYPSIASSELWPPQLPQTPRPGKLSGRMQTPRGMPTLDDLLLPVDADSQWPVQNPFRAASARKLSRQRSSEKLAAFRRTKAGSHSARTAGEKFQGLSALASVVR